MIAIESRIAEARRNEPGSPRPTTQRGHDSPRAEALILGLCASVVVPEDAELVQKRAVDYFKTLRPQNHFHCWLVSRIAILSIQVERSERQQRRVRDKAAINAELSWDSDRRLEAIGLGGQLAKKPEQVLELLQKTPQGCEWLMGRWAMLAHAADVQQAWTPEQSRLAFDLLGTPSAFRDGFKPGTALDIEGRVVPGSDDLASVARREIAALKRRRDLVEGLDRANRSLAVADLGDDADPELIRLRRHEATLHAWLKWYMAQLRYQSPEEEPYRGLWASWIGDHEAAPAIPTPPPLPQPEPVVAAEVKETTPGARFPTVHPPFDLEPEEVPADGEELDIAKILAARRDKQDRKEEANRQARRRKLEKLRA